MSDETTTLPGPITEKQRNDWADELNAKPEIFQRNISTVLFHMGLLEVPGGHRHEEFHKGTEITKKFVAPDGTLHDTQDAVDWPALPYSRRNLEAYVGALVASDVLERALAWCGVPLAAVSIAGGKDEFAFIAADIDPDQVHYPKSTVANLGANISAEE